MVILEQQVYEIDVTILLQGWGFFITVGSHLKSGTIVTTTYKTFQ